MAEPEQFADWPGSPFDGAPIIYAYSRAQAIEDGVLIDVRELAREAGFTIPVALTAAAWAECVAWTPEHGGSAGQSETGRLWDVLWMARCAAVREASSDRVQFTLLRIPNRPDARRATQARLVAVCGPGDNAEPTVTIMEPNET